jgi:hypothetical protein
MIKKHGMPASALYVQSRAEQQSAIIGKIARLLASFERHREQPTIWQGHQLASAIAYMADDLPTLALCELEVLEEQLAAPNSLSTAIADARSPIPLSALRAQLTTLSQPQPPLTALRMGAGATANPGDPS